VTDVPKMNTDRVAILRRGIRDVRARYDRLDRGRTATLRRARTADEVSLEGTYWRVGEALAHEHHGLAHVVLLFPYATQATNDRFSFGRYLRATIGNSDGAKLRFRRVLDSRDGTELDHRLRSMLRLAVVGRPLDWGILGTDILWFFAESDSVRRRWAQDFYAPTSHDASSKDSSVTPSLTTSP